MIRVVGLGAGGHAKAVIESLRARGGYDIVGLLDPNRALWGEEVLGVRVLGDDRLLPEQYESGVHAVFVGLGGTGDNAPRRRLYETAKSHGLRVVPAVHPAAIVSASAVVGEGPAIMAGAVIGAAVRIGDNVVINTGAIVEHDCEIGDHAHVATGARLAGGVRVGEAAHVGLGASVREGVRIGVAAVVGVGAVVVDDVAAGAVVAGVPARPLERAAG